MDIDLPDYTLFDNKQWITRQYDLPSPKTVHPSIAVALGVSLTLSQLSKAELAELERVVMESSNPTVYSWYAKVKTLFTEGGTAVHFETKQAILDYVHGQVSQW